MRRLLCSGFLLSPLGRRALSVSPCPHTSPPSSPPPQPGLPASIGKTTTSATAAKPSGRVDPEGGGRSDCACPARRHFPGGPGRKGAGSTEPPRVARALVLEKTTRYEFEQQRYKCAALSEEDLRQLLALRGSNYGGLLERYHVHRKHVLHLISSLQEGGVEVRVVKRHDYCEQDVSWADTIISAGGDGTLLLAASKVHDPRKLVIGVNTDPERSQGHLCLPVCYTTNMPLALRKLQKGDFRYLWRQRIRVETDGSGLGLVPVDLHEQQLSLAQHRSAHLAAAAKHAGTTLGLVGGPKRLPVCALNEVYIGESISSRASYYELSVDGGPWEKQKSSGVSVCTGSGSSAWSYNINKIASQTVQDVLKIATDISGQSMPNDADFCRTVMERYCSSLVFDPEEPQMFFSIREPIVNRVFSNSRPHGHATRMTIRSRCWDACLVLDGGTSFEFNDGAMATLSTHPDDALKSLHLDP
ncbi:NAD kinase 2, mitochondrial-like [Lethenteron reissneri]|uniref:NAD kinase 2, mitochondrial-like n=1 Tax=Lethenteron reissneri TaxID=7753 RepID=UPI002AB69D5C|nr:NAD kinase 2, mitochondrial-like [Lethenteron reissneri]XP_061421232.1 NAD kinase 2, mitochondrial-like [Lethenteron reissneri]